MRVPSTTLLLRRICLGSAAACAIAVLAWLTSRPVAHAATLLATLASGGALGGIVFHYLEPFRQRSRGWRIVANSLGALGYAVIIGVAWMLGTSGGR